MWPGAVVTGGVLAQHVPQMAFVDDEQPIQALAPKRADPALGEGIGWWRPWWCEDDSSPLRREHDIERAWELLVAVAHEPSGSGLAACRSQRTLRPCWVTCATVGQAVHPATKTRRVGTSKKHSTRRWPSVTGK
jgi:hypothetical protein